MNITALHTNVLGTRNPWFYTDQTDIEFLKAITPGKLAGISSPTVDILLGSDYFWRIVDGGRIVLPSGL